MSPKIYYYALPAILILFLIGGGLYYYNQKKVSVSSTTTNTKTTDNTNGISLGSDTTTQGGSQINPNNSNNTSAKSISDPNEYLYNVSNIRVPINKKIEELLPKLQYTTLFTKDDIINGANEIKTMIDDGKNTLSNLKIIPSFKPSNDKEIESLGFLTEAMDALIAYKNSEDQNEQKKQSELLNWKISESNRVLKEIQIPGASTNTDSSSSSNSQSSTSSSGNINLQQ